MKWSMFIIFFIVISCKLNSDDRGEVKNSIYNSEFVTTIYNAKGFEITQSDSFFTLKIKSLSDNYPFYDSLVFQEYNRSSKAKSWQSNWDRVACQSTTHITFLNALGSFDKVKGLSGIKFMPKDNIFDKIKGAAVVELNNNNTVNIERLISLKPDIFFMYPFEWDSKKYKQAKVNTLLIAEYLEQTAIARLEWIKVFGLITGKEKLADSIFNATKSRYQKLRKAESSDKTVFFNLPFNELWDMPAQNSITVNLINDVGLNYVFKNKSKSIDNISMSKQEVWSKVHEVDYWVIIASRPKDFNLNELKKEEAVYSTFKSVKKSQVIFCNTSQSSYFTQGILEPEIILKDLLFLTGKIENHQVKYFHLLE